MLYLTENVAWYIMIAAGLKHSTQQYVHLSI